MSSCGRWLSDRFAAADPLRRQRCGLGRVVSERQPDRVECDIYTGVFVNHAAIYTMKADGSGLRSLTPKGLNGEPSWSPGREADRVQHLQFGKQATVSVVAAN